MKKEKKKNKRNGCFPLRVEIDKSLLTEMELGEVLWRTRQERGGIPIERIAEIIREEFDDAEIKALIEELKDKENL